MRLIFNTAKKYINLIVICHLFPDRKKLGKIEKLVTNLQDKSEYLVLLHGIVLKKIHRAISLNQRQLLKPYIEINSKLRTEAKNEFIREWFFQINE